MTTTPSSGGRSRQKRWSFRVSPTQPWGRSLLHGVPTTDLLAFPMAFTQDSLLSPDDFVKRASERGASFRVEHLVDLHRVRALVPLLRILQRPSDSATVILVSESAQGMYHPSGNTARTQLFTPRSVNPRSQALPTGITQHRHRDFSGFAEALPVIEHQPKLSIIGLAGRVSIDAVCVINLKGAALLSCSR